MIDWDAYFDRPDTPSRYSPAGVLMVQICEKYPDTTPETARNEAYRLLDQSAGRKHYRFPKVLGPDEKKAQMEKLAKFRSTR